MLGLEMDGDGHKDLERSNENRKMQPRLYWQRPASVQIMKIEKYYQRSKPYEPESAVRVKTEKK